MARLFARLRRFDVRPGLVFFQEDRRVGQTEAVDRLLDVAHDQHRGLFRLCHGVAQQGQEVFPLPGRGVLKFVDHEVREGVPRFFVDKRRVVAAD